MATGRRYLYGNAPGPSVDNTKPTTSQSDRIANNDRPKTAPAPHSKTLHTRKFKSADGYTQIAGYKIGGFLGAGIYTNVWEVTDKSTNTKRAMKIVRNLQCSARSVNLSKPTAQRAFKMWSLNTGDFLTQGHLTLQ
eukprot:scpid104929/ scgid0469/ 